jgi:hypothetical protein
MLLNILKIVLFQSKDKMSEIITERTESHSRVDICYLSVVAVV